MLSNVPSPTGNAAIMSREGLVLKGYLDSVGVPTNGWGHTGPDVIVGKTITRAQAVANFNKDVLIHSQPINKLVKVPLTDNQYDALVSFVYNVGEGNFKKSTLLKKLNKGDYAGAAAEFDKWHTPPEITTRRNAEKEQFLTPYSVALPKARSTDRNRVKVALGSAPVVTKPGSVEEDAAKPSRPSVGGVLASMWANLFPHAARPSLPVLETKGDPVVFTNQKLLQDRGYYLNGLLDGIDGPKYRDAVAAARKDNGMGDGPADADFIVRLPTFGPRPIGEERKKADYAKVKATAPEIAAPVGTMWKGGLASLVLGGAQATDLGSLLDRLKETGDKANDVIGSAQVAIGTIGSVIQFIVSHWQWFAIGFGIYYILKAANFAATIVGNFRRGFF